jgi:hypothetical protein
LLFYLLIGTYVKSNIFLLNQDENEKLIYLANCYEIPSAFPVGDVFREDDVKDGGDDHVDSDEDHQGVKVSGTPKQSEQHERQKSSYNL